VVEIGGRRWHGSPRASSHEIAPHHRAAPGCDFSDCGRRKAVKPVKPVKPVSARSPSGTTFTGFTGFPGAWSERCRCADVPREVAFASAHVI
jgi:hypothetical protein